MSGSSTPPKSSAPQFVLPPPLSLCLWVSPLAPELPPSRNAPTSRDKLDSDPVHTGTLLIRPISNYPAPQSQELLQNIRRRECASQYSSQDFDPTLPH